MARLAPVLISAFLGFLIGVFSIFPFARSMGAKLLNGERCASYYLLNRYIQCEPEGNILKKKEFSVLKDTLKQHIFALIGQGKVSHVSVYLRDLEFGPWMGINEDETYSAASLLKVVVMLTLLRQEELFPGILQQKIEVTPENISPYVQDFMPERSIRSGEIYSVDELLEYMIVYSDNDATNVIHNFLKSRSMDVDLFQSTLEELGFIGQYKKNDNLTVKQSASLFRLLYNSSFLNKSLSMKALDLLSRTTFQEGIRAGVSDHIVVATKFGERITEDGERQIHDCGIVYTDSSPYLLCIMTRGLDPKILAEVIAEISSRVYEEIDQRNRESEVIFRTTKKASP